jgi:hypothetical protein
LFPVFRGTRSRARSARPLVCRRAGKMACSDDNVGSVLLVGAFKPARDIYGLANDRVLSHTSDPMFPTSILPELIPIRTRNGRPRSSVKPSLRRQASAAPHAAGACSGFSPGEQALHGRIPTSPVASYPKLSRNPEAAAHRCVHLAPLSCSVLHPARQAETTPSNAVVLVAVRGHHG